MSRARRQDFLGRLTARAHKHAHRPDAAPSTAADDNENRLWAPVFAGLCDCPHLRKINSTRLNDVGWMKMPFANVVDTFPSLPTLLQVVREGHVHRARTTCDLAANRLAEALLPSRAPPSRPQHSDPPGCLRSRDRRRLGTCGRENGQRMQRSGNCARRPPSSHATPSCASLSAWR